jgi:hypothetical protein
MQCVHFSLVDNYFKLYEYIIVLCLEYLDQVKVFPIIIIIIIIIIMFLLLFLLCFVLCCHIALSIRGDSVIGHWLLSAARK